MLYNRLKNEEINGVLRKDAENIMVKTWKIGIKNEIYT